MPQSQRSQKLGELEALIESGLSCREIATRLGVSAATAIRWTKRAGLTSRRSGRLSPERRAAIFAAARDGASASEVAARFSVCLETARRYTGEPRRDRRAMREQLLSEVAGGLSRRAAAEKFGVSVATAVRWASKAGESARPAKATRMPRERPSLIDDAREDKRARLLSAVASGLSRRKAAELVGLPIATGIRWAREAQRNQSVPQEPKD
jgi:transposase